MSCFITYHTNFAAIAQALNRDLMAEKITTTLVSEELPYEILDEMVERLDYSNVLVCILSRGFEENRKCRDTVAYALGLRKVIVLLRAEANYMVGEHFSQMFDGILVRDISTSSGYQMELPFIIETVKAVLLAYEIMDEMLERLGFCTMVICLLSRGYDEAQQSQKTAVYAQAQNKVIIPLRVEANYKVESLRQLLNGFLIRDISTGSGYQLELPAIIQTVKALLPEAGTRSGMAASGGDAGASS